MAQIDDKKYKIYDKKYDLETSRKIKTRAKQHGANILKSLNKNNIDKGYKDAIVYYENMKKTFGERVLISSQNTLDKALETFSNKIQSKFIDVLSSKNISNTMDKMFFNNDNSNILNLISQFVLNDLQFQHSYQQLKNTLSTAQKQSQQKSKDIEEAYINFINKLKSDDNFIRTIRDSLQSISGLQNTNGMSVDDLINKVIMPYYKKDLEKQLGTSNSQAINIHYPTAAGFLFEALVAQATYDAFSNLQVSHTGAQLRQDDITISAKKSGNNNALNQLENNLLSKIKNFSGSSEISLDKFLDIQEDYGIQVKNATLIQSLKNKSDPFKFNRISNQKGLLTEFRSNIPIQVGNNRFMVQNESALTANQYFQRIAQAIEFLAEQHRIIQVMGYMNVGFVERNRFVWTSDLLNEIKNTSYFLSFSASLGLNKSQGLQDFGAAVGTRRFSFIKT